LLAILKVAEKHHIPIVADEIYGEMVYKGSTFYPLGTLSKTVPVLTVGGIAKVFVVPGWRVGWILIHDKNNLFKDVRFFFLCYIKTRVYWRFYCKTVAGSFKALKEPAIVLQ
jgi:aspartate/methionine/tyrosine aminotransferase